MIRERARATKNLRGRKNGAPRRNRNSFYLVEITYFLEERCSGVPTSVPRAQQPSAGGGTLTSDEQMRRRRTGRCRIQACDGPVNLSSPRPHVGRDADFGPFAAVEWPRSDTPWPFEQVSSALKMARVRGSHSLHMRGRGRLGPAQRSNSTTGRDHALECAGGVRESPKSRSARRSPSSTYASGEGCGLGS